MSWLDRIFATPEPEPTDYRLAAPIDGHDGVFVDPVIGAVLGTVEPDGPHGTEWVWPHGGDQAPAAPADWRDRVAGEGWRS